MSPRALSAGAVVAVVASGAPVAYTLLGPTRYEAESRLQVVPVPAGDERFAGLAVFHEDRGDDAETAARLVETRPVAESVADRLGLDGPEEALERIQATGGRNVVRIRAHAGERARAAQLADAFADAFVRVRSALFQRELADELARLRAEADAEDGDGASLRRRIAALAAYEGQRDPTVHVAGSAVAREAPTRPDRRLVLGVGLPAALLLGALAAFVAAQTGRAGPTAAPAAEIAGSSELHERRVAVLTQRERELARRAAEVAAAERALAAREVEVERRERALEEQPPEPTPPAPGPEPEPEPQRTPEPEPGPRPVLGAEPPPAPAAPGAVRLPTLERLVDELAAAGDERAAECRTYLLHLRQHADVDGRLPPSFDRLVDDVFGDLLAGRP